MALSTYNSWLEDPSHNYDIAVGIFRGFISPILSIVGIIGNIFVIIIFLKETKMSRFSIYCIALAITHIIALFTNSFLDDFLGRGLSYVTKHSHLVWKLDLYSDWSCKIMEYVPNVMYFTASSLVVTFSVDRLLTIYQPILYFSAFYINYAIIASMVCLISGLILNTPLLMSYGLIKDKYHSLVGCYYKCESLITHNDTVILAEFGLYNKVIGAFIIPTFTVLILNGLICYKLWIINRRRWNINDEANVNQLINKTHKIHRRSTGIFFSSSQKQENEIVRIFGHIAFNSAFLFLTLPLVIVMILRLDADHRNLKPRNLYYYNSLKHLSRLFSSVKDISYAVNFFVYLKFLPNFKKGFVNIMNRCGERCDCCCCCPTDTNDNEIGKLDDLKQDLINQNCENLKKYSSLAYGPYKDSYLMKKIKASRTFKSSTETVRIPTKIARMASDPNVLFTTFKLQGK